MFMSTARPRDWQSVLAAELSQQALCAWPQMTRSVVHDLQDLETETDASGFPLSQPPSQQEVHLCLKSLEAGLLGLGPDNRLHMSWTLR